MKSYGLGSYQHFSLKYFITNDFANMTVFRWFSKMFASLCFRRKWPQHKKGLA